MATPARVKNTAATNGDAPRKKVVSLTDYIKQESGYDPDVIVVKYIDVEIFGAEFRVQASGMNVFNVLMLGDQEDTAAIVTSLARIIHPEDRQAFKAHIASLPNYDAKAMIPLITGLVSVASEGKAPTSSGGSSRTTPRKAVASRSVGG